MKNKKLIYTIAAITLIFTFYFLTKNKPTTSKNFFQNTIPLLSNKQGKSTDTNQDIIYPPINPQETKYNLVENQVADELSSIEKDKIVSDLPIRIEDIETNTPIQTTLNIFTLLTDPPQSIRIEIYGPNYNNSGLLSNDAKAFKTSFERAKKVVEEYKVNLKNLQIIYGNRQYIQDTATLWVKEFGLLN